MPDDGHPLITKTHHEPMARSDELKIVDWDVKHQNKLKRTLVAGYKNTFSEGLDKSWV